MTAVRITEIPGGPDGGFAARVAFGAGAEYEVAVTDPAEAGTEELLAWYFEEHLRYPFLDKDYEQEAVARIAAYGEALFGQVLGGTAYADYRRLRDRGFDGCRIEVSGPAGLQRLHWEALRDPELPVPLAVRLPVTRRVHGVGAKFDPPGGRPTLNVLVVTARPDGRGMWGTGRCRGRCWTRCGQRACRSPSTWSGRGPGRRWRRTCGRRGGARVGLVSGRPLRRARRVRGLGALRSRPAGTAAVRPPRVAPFEGKRAFVFFETTGSGEGRAGRGGGGGRAAGRAPGAGRGAERLPVGDADGSEAGLAQRLAEAGVPVTVGMAYSVTVTAAERAMPVLYEQVAPGR